MKFEKVSFEEFKKCVSNANWEEELVREIYENIILPTRSTQYSAGYDFCLPFPIEVKPNQKITFPTGIKVELDYDKVLQCYVRSSLGIKKNLTLANGTGIIDADYYNNDTNEGHIFVCLRNNSDDTVCLEASEKVIQGIIIQYHLTDDDVASGKREGGIGSTN